MSWQSWYQIITSGNISIKGDWKSKLGTVFQRKWKHAHLFCLYFHQTFIRGGIFNFEGIPSFRWETRNCNVLRKRLWSLHLFCWESFSFNILLTLNPWSTKNSFCAGQKSKKWKMVINKPADPLGMITSQRLKAKR